MIREGKTFQLVSIMQTGKKDGMQMFDQCLQNHLNNKLITAETAFKHAYNKGLFQPHLRSTSPMNAVN
jgi:twitching motility protein PilT